MTREEAKFILTSVLHTDGDYMDYLDREEVEAIKFLASDKRQHNTVIPVATIKISDEQTARLVNEAIERARPRGEWSALEYGYRCSVCTAAFYTHSNFCPNCGADMRKGGDL